MTAAALGTGISARGHHLPAAAAVAVATALLVLLPGYAQQPGRVVAVAVLQLVLVAAWVPATGIPARVGGPALGAAAAVGADLLVVFPERPELGSLLAVPGLGFLAAVLHQMLRRAPRRDVVGSLAGVVLLICAVCALAVLLVEPRGPDGGAATTALLMVGTTLVVGHLVDLVLPRPPIAPGLPRGVPGLVLSVLAGTAVALVRHGSPGLADLVSVLLAGLVLGSVAALVGLAAGFVTVGEPGAGGPRRTWAAPLLQAVLPFAACAPVTFSLLLQDVL
ncbi:hypothetical protein DQ238_13335 [Geodermatophilus sp. TF02-6]|uniref:hypothetical protein n=1 Tax=Geodermatophilus sp. TF02-6 TaxID=2250575 RepID=UPI000DEA0BCF|nr:hypothetical protein [Geodermatophilus sp. TF02-6]RBY78176.1 hypothetical protein DQ238_13335 [Geodermatophilus sp. TF02-6]